MLNFLLTLLLVQAADYPAGTVVDIYLTDVEPGWMFTGWTGDVSGPEIPLRITLNTSMNIEATFAQTDGDVTLNVTAPHGTLSVVVVAPDPPPAVCGDGLIEGTEFCDGANLGSETCQTQGFDSGSLACVAAGLANECSFDTSGCATNPPPPPAGQPGWEELANTKLRAVCPPNGFGGSTEQFASRCHSVTRAWNGAAYNPHANQLLIWGGGHADYFGNELYALDLSANPPVMLRLNDPSVAFGFETDPCPFQYPDGRINARHTYDGIEWVPSIGGLILVGGSRAKCGFFSNDTWGLAGDQWQKEIVTGTLPANKAFSTAYDTVTGKLFLDDGNELFTYDALAHVWAKVSTIVPVNLGYTMVLDPVRRELFGFGRTKSFSYDISGAPLYARTNIVTAGASSIIAAESPGLAYHPPSGTVVAWAGGDTVYQLDTLTLQWTEHVFAGGPGVQLTNGTFGRWQWASVMSAFVVVNSVDANAFLFRLP